MTVALRIILVLLLLSLVAGAVTGSTLYYRLSYIWGLILVSSWVISRFSLRSIHVRRKTRFLRSQVGQIFEERYEIQNRGRLPLLWIEVRDESTLPGSHGSHVLTMIGGRESRTYLARTRLTERGVFPLGPTVLESGDLFGLFPAQRNFEEDDSLLVYPMMVDIYNFPNPPGLLPGGEALRRRTAQITSNASGVREYEPGDPLNRIHWVSTARRNRFMTKEFELDPLAEVWLFVDGSSAVHTSIQQPRTEFDPRDVWRKKFVFKLPPATIEYAVTIAASLARFYLARGRSLGLACSGASLQVLPSDRGGRQLGKILETLALFKADGQLPLQVLVEAQARHLPRGSTTVVITPNTSDSVFGTVDLLLRRGLRPVVVLIDQASFGADRNAKTLAHTLQSLGVPVCQVMQGDDLTMTLSQVVNTPQWA